MSDHRIVAPYDLTPAVVCIPDDTNIDVAASSPFEGRVTVPPGSYLWALAGTSSQPEGFDLQLIDGATAQQVCSKRTMYANVTGQGQAPGGAQSPLFVFPKPLLIQAPGLMLVQVFNRSTSVNTVQVALYLAIPKEQRQ
ncbi:MAG: hypothetical protein IT160_07115 [Bryobacterales bacterium]|nr:hypothetical protein [Bryobacterales bacterium]